MASRLEVMAIFGEVMAIFGEVMAVTVTKGKHRLCHG